LGISANGIASGISANGIALGINASGIALGINASGIALGINANGIASGITSTYHITSFYYKNHHFYFTAYQLFTKNFIQVVLQVVQAKFGAAVILHRRSHKEKCFAFWV
jgi:hypothetical protein